MTLAVYVAEHLLMTRRYGLKSSLQKLWGRSASSRTDLAYVFFYEVAFRPLSFGISFVCGAGFAYLLASWTLSKLAWQGVLHTLTLEHPALAATIIFVATDFILYFTHRALHAVPSLWEVHRLHHAATEMTIANGLRRPLTEVFFQELALLLVLFLLFGPHRPDIIILVALARHGVDLIQHSDLPWDYGPLGKIVASPRFHRIHHSADPRDHDLHFGDIFSCWDYLFGTASDRYLKDTSVASRCDLGLGEEEGRNLHSGVRALLHGTVFGHIPTFARLRAFLRREAAPAIPIASVGPVSFHKEGHAPRAPDPARLV